ncbi:MAG: hypothetical protein ACSLEY_01080 [Candidatus Saccharimonadales bacterium]
MSLLEKLHHSLSLPAPDPFGAGLAEEIAAEQAEPEAIYLDEPVDTDAEQLVRSWEEISADLHQDPLWYSEIDE